MMEEWGGAYWTGQVRPLSCLCHVPAESCTVLPPTSPQGTKTAAGRRRSESEHSTDTEAATPTEAERKMMGKDMEVSTDEGGDGENQKTKAA